MSYTPHGKHLVAGEWLSSEATTMSNPTSGSGYRFSSGTPSQVSAACDAAEEAFWIYGYSSREERAAFLIAMADEIEARSDLIPHIGAAETGLPFARLVNELGRTTGQLRLFARHILKGDYLDRRYDEALPERKPLPRPDLRMVQRPIGPVAVFGASNFPLAFSTAGGDTAAALAAGCPVVFNGHSAHPGTGEIVAEAIDAARRKLGVHPGVFSFIQCGTHESGAALVQNPNIKAVGFTGSLRGGRALFNLCAARPEPIPFFGELGSVNPVFVLPEALRVRGNAIGASWAESLVIGAGQFCTNPGITFVREGEGSEAFMRSVSEKLSVTAPQVMLTTGIAKAYRDGRDRIASVPGVREVFGQRCGDRLAAPFLFETSAEVWLENRALGEEVFGPLGLVVRVRDSDVMLTAAKRLEGQLTATVHLEADDLELGSKLLPILERKAGRVLANGFPTGVEVADAMVHGGPYPASTNFGATSVGTLSIRRFLRPVCYQNIPEALLPADLRSSAPNTPARAIQ
ncbi:aldehyde dehydrogenase (NADP(+)) [Microvirga lotononidis]|nr:aldehyde dehydrogenase (NADP(+)) [Microvirga lotononidis]WQO30540.1 aldehyde dehydrogenase (NADP(+)) [Microvirga lotononidis]